MDKTNDDTRSSDLEDSFRPVQKQRPRAIVDSDSDSDVADAICHEEVSSTNFLDESDEDADHEEDSFVEDSFRSEDDMVSSTKRRSSIQKKLANKLETSDFSDEKSNSIVESTDEEDSGIPNRAPEKNSRSSNLSEKNKSRGADIVDTTDDDDVEAEVAITPDRDIVNNSVYREAVVNSDDDPEDDIINDTSEDELWRPESQQSEDLEIIEKSASVVEVSSDEEGAAGYTTLKQTNIKSFFNKPSEAVVKQEPQPKTRIVGGEEYQEQLRKVSTLEMELSRAKNAMRVIKLENLPDKGKVLVEKEKFLVSMLAQQREVLANMAVDSSKPAPTAADKIEVAWEQIEAGVDAVGPRTFGKKGVARFNAEKQLAVETLDSLHKSLDTCPTETDLAEDPKGLKVPLMQHQRRALAWLLWRERQKPAGGLLADDMGLGKTLTMISLVMKSHELHPDENADKENYRDKYPGGTLVVCPASLINQWSGEIERRTKRGMLGVEVYHGQKRETKSKRLAKHDVVITTYALALSELNRQGPLFGVRWRRIIIDEAHQIRNYKSRTSEAIFRLSGKARWALTGTPVHNKELDMYAIFKFLRCSPFDDLQVWKHWVSDKSAGGAMRLHAIISSLMLRRTKAELVEKGSLQSLPQRSWELIPVKLQKDEMDVYQKVLIFSRTLFAQFLHQRAEKNQDAYDMRFTEAPPDPNGEYFKMRNKLLKLNRVKEVSQHEILVLLLRLRQICCHPSLIKQMLQGEEDLGNADDEEESEELNLLEQLNKMTIDDEDGHLANGLGEEGVGLKEASKGYLNPSNSVFLEDRQSSKIRALIQHLKEKVSANDKAIVVSQWTNLLELVAIHVKEEGIVFDRLTGKIPVHKRMAIVDGFNDPKSDTKVLLLSLTAGGVGLNLIGANHLFLLDLHWNPQLESQAQDRIYRVGQNKPISVYKFMAVDTIEERIKALQEKKLEIADSMLTGSKRVASSKLSLQDLKMLFDFK